jgi:hypothetical protein
MKLAPVLNVIPAQAGIQLIKRNPRSGTKGFACFAAFCSCWIPACAGMTVFL